MSSTTLQLYILCYNRAELARQAIESALAQTDKRFQLVVSDNSTDGRTKAMVEAEFPQVAYRLRQPHLDAFSHFNLCLDEAAATHVCLFHDDDLLAPDFVEQVLAAMAAQPGAAAIGVNAWVAEERKPLQRSFKARGKLHVIRGARHLAAHYFSRHQTGIAPFPGYVYATAHIAGLRFEAGRGKYSDVSWLLRVAHEGDVVWLVKPLMTYRLHATNDSRQESIGDRLKLLAFFKSHQPWFGRGLIEDLRYFIYKKALERDRVGRLPGRRRETLRAGLSSLKLKRVFRLDHHAALVRKIFLRFDREPA